MYNDHAYPCKHVHDSSETLVIEAVDQISKYYSVDKKILDHKIQPFDYSACKISMISSCADSFKPVDPDGNTIISIFFSVNL